MSYFKGLKLTKLGETLLANINGNLNETLTFTSGEIGAGIINSDDEIRFLTTLKEKWKDLDIISIEKDEKDETIVKLELQFSNIDLKEAKIFREIGIYAKGNNGEPVLFAYSNAGENYDYIPLPQDNPQNFTIQINLKITSNSKIDAIINMAGFVTIGKMIEYLKNKLTQISTIAELQSRKNLKVGDIVEVLGYYSAGDGAGHKRIIANEDDGSGVQLNNKLWANIVHNGQVNVSWFGAKGDGVTDDTLALEKALKTNKKIIMNKGNTYKIFRAIYLILDNLEIHGNGATIIADDLFKYNENTCYGFFQFQASNMDKFIIKDLNVNITTNGILYGDRVTGDERSCPIFRLGGTKTIYIDNCNWLISSSTGNRAILCSEKPCSERVCISNSNFTNKCSGNAGGVIAIKMKNDSKDLTSYLFNCSLISDSCDELYTINNAGSTKLFSTVDSCILNNTGGFVDNSSTKKTIVLATNNDGTGDLSIVVNTSAIIYTGKDTDRITGVFRFTSINSAKQKAVFNGCEISTSSGHAIESAYSGSGSPKHISVEAHNCYIKGMNKNELGNCVDVIGNFVAINCDIISYSTVSYFYPVDYTLYFVLKNCRIELTNNNPTGVIFTHNNKRHIINIQENVYYGNYKSKVFSVDIEDPNAPNVDMEVISNNVVLS